VSAVPAAANFCAQPSVRCHKAGRLELRVDIVHFGDAVVVAVEVNVRLLNLNDGVKLKMERAVGLIFDVYWDVGRSLHEAGAKVERW
jgi:hypothetical protein